MALGLAGNGNTSAREQSDALIASRIVPRISRRNLPATLTVISIEIYIYIHVENIPLENFVKVKTIE